MAISAHRERLSTVVSNVSPLHGESPREVTIGCRSEEAVVCGRDGGTRTREDVPDEGLRVIRLKSYFGSRITLCSCGLIAKRRSMRLFARVSRGRFARRRGLRRGAGLLAGELYPGSVGCLLVGMATLRSGLVLDLLRVGVGS